MKNKISIIGLGYVGLPLAVNLQSNMKWLALTSYKIRVEQLEKREDILLLLPFLNLTEF